MKSYVLLILLVILCSCSNPCEGLECLSEDAFAFTIKSSDSGADLIFENDPQFSKENINVFFFSNGVNQTAQVQFQTNAVIVRLEPGVKAYFVEAGNKTDTLNIQSCQKPSSECCPSTTTIESKSVNEVAVATDEWIIALYR